MDRTDRSEDHRFLEQVLAAGDTVVDVGANVGALAIHAAGLVGDAGRVVAIEAHPRVFGYLKGNIELNGCRNIEALNLAAGAESGTIRFSDLKADDMNHIGDYGIEVRVERLDDILDAAEVDLLKVDVEGFELPVFKGATRTLAATRAVYFESDSDLTGQYGYESLEVVELLRDCGFEIVRPEGLGWVRMEAGEAVNGRADLAAIRDGALLDRLTSVSR